MDRSKIKICVMRVPGTNRDSDIANCFDDLGVEARILRLNDVAAKRNLHAFDGLVIPGGFAYGDYVRAGAIWGKKLNSLLGPELTSFVREDKPILGICNGFQVLLEAGLFADGGEENCSITLTNNRSSRFECRWVTMKKNQKTRLLFAKKLQDQVRFPIAHGEGRFIASSESVIKDLSRNGQIVLQYSKPNGKLAAGEYPDNPNGSAFDIAGICNNAGTVFGLMPHPENAYFGFQLPDWSAQGGFKRHGDGYGLAESMIEYIEEEF